MPRIKPFRGIRPPQSLVAEVAARPYDVLNSEEARIEAGDHQKSLYHITKPRTTTASTSSSKAGLCKTSKNNTTSMPKR